MWSMYVYVCIYVYEDIYIYRWCGHREVGKIGMYTYIRLIPRRGHLERRQRGRRPQRRRAGYRPAGSSGKWT